MSGVNKSEFNLRVLEGGITQELSIIWPGPLIDLEISHQKRVRQNEDGSTPTLTMYYPGILALEDSLKKKRLRANDNFLSTARIELPFAVQTQIEFKTNLLFKLTATKVVYVELKAMTNT